MKIIRKYKEFGFSRFIKEGLIYVWNKTIRRWWYSDYWIVGKIFELRGSIFFVDGLKFSAAGPNMTTKFKSGFLLHDYEKNEREAVKKFLDKDTPVIELGAGFGVISCTINKKLSNSKDHFVVEANPHLILPLEKNREINGCGFTIINKAVGYDSREISMYLQENIGGSGTKHKTGEEIKVETITLGGLIDLSGFRIANLVADIEGTEFDIIEKEFDVLKNKIKMIIFEFHPNTIGQEKFKEILIKLKSGGFDQVYQKETVFVFRNMLL